MRCFLLSLLFIFLMGCTAANSAEETPPLNTPLSPTETTAPTLEITESSADEPITLRVWVPPQFDPASGTTAGDLFQSRLTEFATRRPNVNIDVRVKNIDGPGGILDTLVTARNAAPLALPDLVAMPRYGMETAAQNGVLHPFDGLTTVLDDPDWYNFARELSHVKNATFGVPFAGDALLMTYRVETIPEPPVDWTSSLAITGTLTFPAADPKALITLLQYQSIGGLVIGEDEQPLLDQVFLTEVLTYYQQASMVDLMPFWLAQFETDEQSWDAYDQKQGDIAFTWVTRYLELLPADSLAAPIPTAEGDPFTLADGWAWTLTTNFPDRQLLAAQLAEFLTTSGYLASWTEAAGLIPPHPSSLAAWESSTQRILLDRIVPSAKLLPPLEVVKVLGPLLQQATISVLKSEADANTAAQTAVEKLIAP